jgi:hypothetical protein
MYEGEPADLLMIKETAQNIRQRMGRINAAEHWIAIGGELAALNDKLARLAGGHRRRDQGISRAGDNERIGWLKAFELGLMPLSQAHANKLMAVYKFSLRAPEYVAFLPVYFEAIYYLSRVKDHNVVLKLIDDGRITPTSTIRDLKNFAHELGLDTKSTRGRKPKPKPETPEPELDRSMLSLSAQQKLDAMNNRDRRRLEAEFEQRFYDEKQKWLEWNRKLVEDYKYVQAGRKGMVTKEEGMALKRCLHPDNSASQEMRTKAFLVWQRIEHVLMSEEDSPTTINFPGVVWKKKEKVS